jgi:hypothetical protein
MDTYESRVIHHSREWVFGRPKHNHIDNECVRDFSCCYPDLFTKDKDKREQAHFDLMAKLNFLN